MILISICIFQVWKMFCEIWVLPLKCAKMMSVDLPHCPLPYSPIHLTRHLEGDSLQINVRKSHLFRSYILKFDWRDYIFQTAMLVYPGLSKFSFLFPLRFVSFLFGSIFHVFIIHLFFLSVDTFM